MECARKVSVKDPVRAWIGNAGIFAGILDDTVRPCMLESIEKRQIPTFVGA
jgi:hypothetical protein